MHNPFHYRSELLLLFLLAVPHVASAQDLSDRIETRIRFSGHFYDNFFQANDAAVAEEVRAVAAAARVAAWLDESNKFRVYVDLDYALYDHDDLEPSSSITGGVRLDGRQHGFDTYVETARTTRLNDHDDRGRPAFQPGDDLDVADIVGTGGEYRYRVTPAWQLIGRASFQRLSFDSIAGSTDSYRFGGAVRYRGFGYAFSPEVGFGRGRRAAASPEDDHSQNEAYIKISSVPVDFAYVSVRYRLRDRDYSVVEPTASNYGREDSRRQFTLSADLRVSRNVAFNLYHVYENSDSSLDTRGFTARMTSLGVTLRF